MIIFKKATKEKTVLEQPSRANPNSHPENASTLSCKRSGVKRLLPRCGNLFRCCYKSPTDIRALDQTPRGGEKLANKASLNLGAGLEFSQELASRESSNAKAGRSVPQMLSLKLSATSQSTVTQKRPANNRVTNQPNQPNEKAVSPLGARGNMANTSSSPAGNYSTASDVPEKDVLEYVNRGRKENLKFKTYKEYNTHRAAQKNMNNKIPPSISDVQKEVLKEQSATATSKKITGPDVDGHLRDYAKYKANLSQG